MADGQMLCWSKLPCVMAGRVAPLVPVADSATPNSPVTTKKNANKPMNFNYRHTTH